MSPAKQWFDDFFGSDYLKIYSGNFDTKRTIQEVNFIIQALSLSPQSKILDLCCGQGRHSIELSIKGMNVVSQDLIQAYLDIAEEFVFIPDMTHGDGFDPVLLNTFEAPDAYSISSAYPNPFNPVVNFDIDLDGEHYVDARVYNISGQEIAVIHDGMLSGDMHKLSWVASNKASGIYFIKVSLDGVVASNNKIILLK